MKLKKNWIFYFLIFPALCLAQEHKVYQVDDEKLIMVNLDGKWVSESCVEKKHCKALEIPKQYEAKFQKTKKRSNIGGKEPGAIRCRIMPGTTVVIGKNPATQSFQSLCVFEDKSAISTASL